MLANLIGAVPRVTPGIKFLLKVLNLADAKNNTPHAKFIQNYSIFLPHL